MPEKVTEIGSGDADLLKKIRQRYRYGMDKWRAIRDDGQKNMRYISGDPWDDADKEARKNRPTVCPDELNQYVNQVVNTARQNPRGVKVDPAGDGATDQLAEYRENRIRAIEYACNAPQVYINGLQAAVERNIGYWKVSRYYVSDLTDEQEIVILPVQNPDSVVMDPDYKELDASDAKWCFELERIPIQDFEQEYPNAQKKSFSADDFGADSAMWYDGKTILIASYWEVRTERKKLGKLGREVTRRVAVQQYVTNGAEILQKPPEQPGPYIPIVPVFGKEIWVGNQRQLLSLVSLARDPQKALAYVMSAMLENVGQLPKTTYVGAVGQFNTDKEAWDTINTVFHPYVQYDMVTDESSGQPLPAPQRTPLTPDFAAYSNGVDICRRAIMSAMGLQALPTPAQRANQKSGIAVEKIESQQSIGSYHLIDNYERAIKLTGRIINGWLKHVDLGETDKPVRLADGKHKLVSINQPVQTETDQYHIPIDADEGRYQVTISSGPSHESQREEASDFADTLIENLPNLPLAPPQAAQILGLVVKLKQLGPLGDQMVDIISPQNAQMGQQLGALQQQGQMMAEQMQKMQAQLQQLTMERQAKIIENQGKLQVEQLHTDTQLAVAQINASKDSNEAFAEAEIAKFKLLNDSAHERGMQAADHAHERGMAQMQHAHALTQQQQGAQQQMAVRQAQASSDNAGQNAQPA